MKSIHLSIVALALALTTTSLSTTAQAKGDGSRGFKKFGITGGALTDPFPNIWGVNANYNVTNFFRAHVGYGGLSGTDPDSGAKVTTTSIGGGGKLFVPGWNLSPYVGFALSSLSGEGNMSFGGQDVTSTGSSTVTYLSFGFDWQTDYGLNIGIGMTSMLAPAVFAEVGMLPSFQIGWFF